GLALSGLALIALNGQTAVVFSGQLSIDPLGMLFKWLFIAIGAASLYTSMLSKELPDRHMGEYYILLVSILFGMFLMASANDLLMVYLGLEMVSILSFAMAGYRSHDKRSSEAALKYVIYGGAASGLMLFGISLIYGLLGTTELSALHTTLANWASEHFATSATTNESAFPITLLTSIIFMFAGIGYKIAAVPFHMWSPDVYEGAPTPFSAFLSVGPKAAGFALLMRVFIGIFVPFSHDGVLAEKGFISDADGFMTLVMDLPLPAVLGIVAALTMTIGNLAAIAQNNVKRLLAYSSIAHAGYLLMGFVVLSESSMHAVILYTIFYYLMNLGAFTVVQAVRDQTGGEMIDDLEGLGAREPLLAVAMVVFMLSLTGLPPLAGFIGKFYIFASVLERGGFWLTALAILGVVNSAISLYYYMRVVKAMYLSDTADTQPLGVHRGYVLVTTLLAVPTLVLGLYWSPLSTTVRNSLQIHRGEIMQAMIDAPQNNLAAVKLEPNTKR
ncbi:MAG: NADH-quinone oxidoreductase subunit N, partial [Myxococcota bacterium]|nr:NADH-quinone oxidoreductase subunit N [Myxococcota bacterium]